MSISLSFIEAHIQTGTAVQHPVKKASNPYNCFISQRNTDTADLPKGDVRKSLDYKAYEWYLVCKEADQPTTRKLDATVYDVKYNPKIHHTWAYWNKMALAHNETVNCCVGAVNILVSTKNEQPVKEKKTKPVATTIVVKEEKTKITKITTLKTK